MKYKIGLVCVLIMAAVTALIIVQTLKAPQKMPQQQEQSEQSHDEEKNNADGKEVQQKAQDKENQKIAYLTIDDGPTESITMPILDILKEKGVKATFFVLPHENVDAVYARILGEGHAIGNHSFSHSSNLYTSEKLFEEDLLKARRYIQQKLDYTTTVYRFPGGAMGRNKNVINQRVAILNKHGYRYFDWNVSTSDTDPKLSTYGNEEEIVNLLISNVVNKTGGRKQLVVLMHDSPNKIYTVKALPKMIDELKNKGYSFDVLTNYPVE